MGKHKSLVKHWESKPKSKRPSSKSYENLKAAVNDPLTTAKLQFFSFVAGILQPFLKSYQTDQPMIPFMYNDIFALLQKILQSVVKPDLLVNCRSFSDLLKLYIDSKDTFMKLKDMSFRVATLTLALLRETYQISKNQISSFFNNVIKLVTTIAKKLFEKSPTSHNVVRNSVIFDPLIACQEHVGTLQSKLKKLFDHLIKHKLFQARVCDKITQQFLEFVAHDLKLLTDLFQSYKREGKA